jgi:hypothetical protein
MSNESGATTYFSLRSLEANSFEDRRKWIVSKGKDRKPPLFTKSAGGTLRIQEDLLYTLALDIKVLRLTCHNSYAKLNLFIDEARGLGFPRPRIFLDTEL